jgi:HlyD family secretion protein
MMMKTRRVIAAVVGTALLAAGFVLVVGFRSPDANQEFQLVDVKRGDFEIIVSSTGTLNALGTVNVGAQVSGTVQKVFADYNDEVEKGDLLLTIDPTSFEAAVRETEATVAKAEAAFEKSKAEYDRNVTLHEKGYLSDLDFLSLRTSLKAAEADLVAAKAKLSQAETNLENTKIRSPISGTVIERSVDAGQTIASSFQAPELFVIAEDLKKMQIDADVDENDIGQIKKGQKVRFSVQAYPDRIFTGTVRQVRLQPETISNVVNYTVIVDVSNSEGLLLPGMTATADFLVLDHPNALLIPNSALSFVPPLPDSQESARANGRKPQNGAPRMESVPEGMTRVFLLSEDGHPRPAFLRAGQSDGVYTEVTGGTDLKEEAQVITGVTTRKKSKKAAVGKNSLLPTPGGPGRGRGPF